MNSKSAPDPETSRGRNLESNNVLAVLPRDERARQCVEAVRGRRIRVSGRWLVSFVSASYLGFEQDVRVRRSASRAINAWGVSLAIPRRLARDRITAQLEHAIASFVCQPAALVFPSTTHAALDFLPALATPSGAVFVDVRAYPTSLAGVRAAQRRGARVYWFRHNDPSSLQSALRAAVNARHKVVVCAGVYPEGAEPAPLPEFAGLASTFGALLYVDDSHGIGIFGKGPATAHSPYGRGSGGLTRFLGLGPGRVVVGGTLGKAIGVPMAFIAGSKPLMDYIESVSETFVHSTPPSIVQVAAALKALHLHETEGDDRKRRLVSLVRRFQRGLQGQGITVESKGLFPIQTIPLTSAARAQQVCTLLQRRSVWPLLQLDPPDHRGGAVLRFVLTALHSASEVDLAIAALTESEALSPGTLARQTATEGVGRPRASRTT